ncbi:hypothetical protein CXG81DRAFT_27010 [Caulochytrium protostelioides]|uniref:Mediator of RNA polymerase II transcription subunit 4 n=1 Tax=Caulochytrium protostelioides TaxID=1555241 RepID=A0A4P9X586_9FUNG|nr:hypothetical protein CXG81DRAFT_27010 [Caulochytrium protostelioides]|eukprot:RKP00288.1 hypothetical protein CXG81DRAFT_27010 [Caulochytrium protostelioides]
MASPATSCASPTPARFADRAATPGPAGAASPYASTLPSAAGTRRPWSTTTAAAAASATAATAAAGGGPSSSDERLDPLVTMEQLWRVDPATALETRCPRDVLNAVLAALADGVDRLLIDLHVPKRAAASPAAAAAAARVASAHLDAVLRLDRRFAETLDAVAVHQVAAQRLRARRAAVHALATAQTGRIRALQRTAAALEQVLVVARPRVKAVQDAAAGAVDYREIITYAGRIAPFTTGPQANADVVPPIPQEHHFKLSGLFHPLDPAADGQPAAINANELAALDGDTDAAAVAAGEDGAGDGAGEDGVGDADRHQALMTTMMMELSHEHGGPGADDMFGQLDLDLDLDLDL